MGKWSIVAMTAVLALSLTACGSKNDKPASGSEASSGGSPEQVVLKVATDASYAPFESMDKDKIVGFDADFLDAVMKEAGLSYKLENVGWDALLAEMTQGDKSSYKAAISAITITDDRKQSSDFTIPYFESVNMILTKEGSTVANALELKDKKVAVQGATTADELMKGIMGDSNTNLKRFDSNTLALLELDNGGVDAVVADFGVVQAYVQEHPDKKYKAIYDKNNFAPEYYGIMLQKGSADLKSKLDAAVEKVRASDEYKAMYKKWIGVEPDTADLLKTK
ncbi:basic amino acid ABC transporter substrate-binding protein [Cohnella sp. AR92]|uniref:basic amino acid ABC transporter substrate-binding protein n=1 Tax=Cohnella sp. AR92 TaxID=648716 RepID=UPI000F8DF251|nr:basic amino acid ABC transporter substrate-binding protein [Cohnella sp. AR92]RUS46790.1 basic amino acid ABC transporter substrate-binding protein [Cohnella sp. AR92]